MSLAGKRCLVTGATGFLGTNLARLLVEQGAEVTGFGLPGSETRWLDEVGVQTRFGDITDRADVQRACEGQAYVFHVAGDTSFWRRHFERQRRVNVEGTEHVVDACREQGVRRLVLTGTIDALGYDPDGLADETWSHYNYEGTGYNYADTKRLAERRARELAGDALPLVVIYPGSMLGPFDFTLQYGRLFAELRDGEVPLCPRGGIAFGHVVEVARAHIAAATVGRPGEGYICAGINATYRELFSLMAAKVGARPPRLDAPRWLLVAAGYGYELASRLTCKPPAVDPGMARYMSVRAYYDSSKAQRELDYRVVPLTTMVDDAHAWYVEHDLL